MAQKRFVAEATFIRNIEFALYLSLNSLCPFFNYTRSDLL